MTFKITRRFVIEISSTSLFITVPYVGQFVLGRQVSPLDRWKSLRNDTGKV